MMTLLVTTWSAMSAKERLSYAIIITLDETWAKSYEPQMKRQSNEWRYYGSPRKSSSSEPQQCESYGDSHVRL